MTYDEFKQNFLPEFLKIKSFKGKMDYANQNLQRIGSGTGRVVYDIDGEKVLKLAKNPKGIAQNETEAGIGYYRDSQNIVAIVFDSSDDDNWLIAEKAKKVNETRIKQLTGIPSLNDLFYHLRNWYSSNNGRGNIFHQDPEMIEQLNENEFVQELIEFIANYGQQPGDYGRPSTYGEVLRDGHPTIVVTDYGLNDEVYNTYYAPKKEKYQMYEMYNFADGNDDMLGDMPPQDAVDTRQSMWALMPYGVGDGPGVVNEDFISFVLNRDKYPTRALPSAPYLVDEFHDCVNNLNEVLNHAGDKKKFYNNLLELQDYLIRGKFYDREPLEKETMELNEVNTRNVEPTTLEKDYSDTIASAFAAKLNLGEPQYLGGGGYGYAYLINDNKVLKLTTDACEVDAGGKTNRAKPQTLVYVHKIYKIRDTEKSLSLYALIEDHIADKPFEEFERYSEIIDSLDNDLYFSLLRILIKGQGKEEFEDKTITDFPEVAKLILSNNPDANIGQIDREKAYEFMMGLYEIKLDLLRLHIKSDDYLTLRNLGYKDGILTYFDIGGCKVPEPKIPDDNVVSLPESQEVLDEGIKRDVADNIANQVAQKYNYGMPKYIDSGFFGAAYDIDNNMILKVTSDRSEANENLELIGKPLKRIAEPYKVFSVKPKSGETETYVIILEKLRTDPAEFKRLQDRMNFAFDKIMGVKFSDVIDHYIHGYDYDDGVDEEKVGKYMLKNPEDAKYFAGILAIAKEAKQYGVESTDFLNSSNLGYKKDGSLGFFDVGFGNYFFQSNKQPEELQIDEDSTSLYSTENSFGQDNFPLHNNDDSSPSIQNDLNANSAISEDLEYNHVVGDATQDKYAISEDDDNEHVGEWFHGGNGEYSGSDFLYVTDELKEALYYARLRSGNIYKLKEEFNYIVAWALGQSEGMVSKEDVEKNGGFNNIFELFDPNDNTNQLTERVKSYMPGSQSVEVKKKCRLGGLGNTSVACNQGDINNLELKSIKESVISHNKTFWAWVSPDDRFIQIPTLSHMKYLEKIYPEIAYDYDRLADKAFEEGWVRVSYEKFPDFRTDLNINGQTKNRVIHVFKTMFYDLVKYGNNSIYLEWIEPHGQIAFTTRDSEGKQRLFNYINEEISQSFEKQIEKDNVTHQLDKKLVRTYKDGIDINPVYAVNGDEVRDSGFIEWVEGGNHWVDADLPEDQQKYAKHIPEDELWVDDVHLSKPNDFEAILLHERTESYLIKYFGYEYDDAHEIANKLELLYRQKTNDISDDEESERVASLMYTAFKKNFKPKGDKKFRNEGVGDVAAEKQFGIEPPHRDFEDKFARDQEEEVIYTDPNSDLVIIKNPKSLNSIFGYARGVIDPEGNLYIEQRATKIHIDILYELGKLGLIKNNNYWDTVLPEDFITVQRFLRTNKILLGESNCPMVFDDKRPKDSKIWREIPSRAEAEPIYQRFLDKAKQKNPKFEFINELLQYYAAENYNYNISEAENVLNEAEIMSLQNLPFKQEVENLGGKIYSVGGAVRDEFLGKPSKDLDVLITGVPFEQLEVILSKYGRVDAVGKSFGVLKFKPQGTSEEIDIAIPRTETATGEGGHQGFDVTSDHALPIEKDLERRDFTINAIAKDAEGNIVDPYGGQEDLKNKIIRVVNPQAFSDDPLRMLRAVQFASRFGFTIEPETMKMIHDNASRVKEIAPERILTEFDKIVKNNK